MKKRKAHYHVEVSDPVSPRPFTAYLGRHGYVTYRTDRIAQFRTEESAKEAADYWQNENPLCIWKVVLS